MLNEIIQAQKDKQCMIPLISSMLVGVVKFKETESRMVVAKGWGVGIMGS
jgi:hypothetical protein